MSHIGTIEIKAKLEELWKVEDSIQRLLDEGLISESVFGNVIVAVTEATLNAIHHGAANDPNRTVRVEIGKQDGELHVAVSDFGEGFDYENLPDPTDPGNIEDVNGRGVFIMKSLCDAIRFEDKGATVHMSFFLDSKLSVGA